MIPKVDELRSSPMVHRFGDCFNPPGLTNFLGCVQSDTDLTAFQSLTFPPLSMSTTLTAAFALDGVHFQSLGVPVTTVWYPDRIERTAEWRGLVLRSILLLPPGRNAAVVFIDVKNVSGEAIETAIGLNIQGTAARQTEPWKIWIPPKETDNEVGFDEVRNAFVFTAKRSRAVSVQGISRPSALDSRVRGNDISKGSHRSTAFRIPVTLAPGETTSLQFVNVLAETVDEALSIHDELMTAGRSLIQQNEDFWNAEFRAAFSLGSDQYGGHLPTLVTDDTDIRKLYYMGALGVIYFRRDSPHAFMGRAYDTLMPRYWQTVTFLWDYFLSAGVHAQLDPHVMRRNLEHWMHIDIYQHFGTEYLTGGPVGNWYSVNDFAMVSMIREYVRWTGDTRWLGKHVHGTEKTVGDYLTEYASKWKSLKSANGLADYGGINNLLECVSTYVHEVASLNAANVQNMRFAAELLEIAGRGSESGQFRDDASALASKLQDLYVQGAGFWNARYPDGTRQPVRHCYDLLTVLNTIPDDLTDSQRREMVAYFKDELMTEVWMHALSPKDDNVLFDVRPDHQWTGAYPAWPPETVRGLYRIGEAELALKWLKGLAKSANQGPFGQAHFAEMVVAPEDGGALKAPFEFPYITDWSCSSNGSWTMAIIEGLFGVRATPADGVSAEPQFAGFDPTAELRNVSYQGKLFTVNRNGISPQ